MAACLWVCRGDDALTPTRDDLLRQGATGRGAPEPEGHLSCLAEADGWYFNLVYIITFGGFIGLATFLPSFYYSQFHMTKVQAGSYTVLATLTGSATRVLGGYFSDRIGGITTLSVVFLIVIGGLFGLMSAPSLTVTTLLFMLCFAALGAGNGATFPVGATSGAAYDRCGPGA